MRNSLRRHPFATYYAVACLIPVLIVGVYAIWPYPYELMHGGPFDYPTLMQETADRLGVDASTSALLPLLRICLAEPVVWVIMVYAAAPSIAGLVVCAVLVGGPAVRTWLNRWRPWREGVGAREGLAVYATAVAVMIGSALATFVMRYAWGGEVRAHFPFELDVLSWGFLTGLLGSAFLDQGGLLEEGGWRGYALPLLQERMRSPLAAAVFLGVLWGCWHIPRDIGAGSIATLGLVPYLALKLPMFIAGTVVSSIIITYFFNRVGGSVLIAVIVHGLGNDAVGLSGHELDSEAALTMISAFTSLVPQLIVAFIIVGYAGRKLGLRSTAERAVCAAPA